MRLVYCLLVAILFVSCATERIVHKVIYVKPDIIKLEKLDTDNRQCIDVLKDYEDIIDIYNKWYDNYYRGDE